MKYLVKTNTSLEYVFFAQRFEIFDGIIHFYDKTGDPVWIIKDWLSVGCSDDEEEEIEEKIAPDDYYEKNS